MVEQDPSNIVFADITDLSHFRFLLAGKHVHKGDLERIYLACVCVAQIPTFDYAYAWGHSPRPLNEMLEAIQSIDFGLSELSESNTPNAAEQAFDLIRHGLHVILDELSRASFSA